MIEGSTKLAEAEVDRLAYYRMRALRERNAALGSIDPRVKAVHLTMAAAYEARIDEALVDRVIDGVQSVMRQGAALSSQSALESADPPTWRQRIFSRTLRPAATS